MKSDYIGAVILYADLFVSDTWQGRSTYVESDYIYSAEVLESTNNTRDFMIPDSGAAIIDVRVNE